MQISFHPRVWFNSIFPALWPIENEMFAVAISQEPADLGRQLNSQVAEFNSAYRYQKGREVFFYKIVFGIFDLGLRTTIDVGQREVPWVEFVLKLKSGASMKARFYVLDGKACYIRYSSKTNRRAVKEAKITKMQRFSWDVEAVAERNPVNVLGLAEELRGLSSEDAQDPAFPQFMSPEEAYEVTLAQGDFLAIGELPAVGMILALLSSDSQNSGIYLGRYDEEEVEFIAESLTEAADKLRPGATASTPPA